MDVTERLIMAGTIQINVATAGEGPPVLLLHGFPHTWRIWTPVMEELAAAHQVIAPDLRGFGGSTQAEGRYDASTLAGDVEHLLDALGIASAPVVAIDAAVAPAFLLARRRPERVTGVVLMEGTLGRLPGAEEFFASGPPWWFGFHLVPGLAETVLAGNESAYVNWFLATGAPLRGVPEEIRAPLLASYARPGSLHGALAYYRAIPESSEQLAEAAATGRLTVPTVAIGAATVGSALAGQLRPITDSLTEILIEDSGHIIPIDQPEALLEALLPFLDSLGGATSARRR